MLTKNQKILTAFLQKHAEDVVLTKERAQELWKKRGIQNSIKLEPSDPEWQYVKKVWDTLAGNKSWMDAFFLILRGKDPLQRKTKK